MLTSDKPVWPFAIYFVAMLAVLLSAPDVLDSKKPIELDQVPVGWLLGYLAVVALGLFFGGEGYDWKDLDDEERSSCIKLTFGGLLLFGLSLAIAVIAAPSLGLNYAQICLWSFLPLGLFLAWNFLRRHRSNTSAS